jgi:MoxR-like ATPase
MDDTHIHDREAPRKALQDALYEIKRVIVGQDAMLERLLVSLLAGGHVLLEGVPGLAKTLTVRTLAQVLGGSFGRIQFTPDLLPTDVVGLTVWDRNRSAFDFRPGPVFNNIVLADEINRASPKTQSALLESMAEAQVTVDGTTYQLADPFMVIATQNPIEHEGTYPLPESQLDRFLMRVSVGYPTAQAELDILDAHGDHDALADISAVISAAQIAGLATAARGVHVAPGIKGYLVDLANATRRHPSLALGMSPRATLALQRVARSRAAAEGRSYVVPDDLKALAGPVLAHRLLVTPEAQLQGVTSADALAEVLHAVPVPAGKTR